MEVKLPIKEYLEKRKYFILVYDDINVYQVISEIQKKIFDISNFINIYNSILREVNNYLMVRIKAEC